MEWDELTESCDTWCIREFESIDFGDERLNKRFVQVANRMLNKSMSSINEACGSWKEAKAAYRMFDNNKISRDEIISAHQEKTVQRIGKLKQVLVIQDTSFLNYNNHLNTTGLGPIGTRGRGKHASQGLILHSAFAIDPTNEGMPLGVLDQKLWTREARIASKEGCKLSKLERDKQRHKILATTPFEQKESYKWVEMLHSTHELVPDHVELIHVCDREADITEFILEAQRVGAKVLVRANSDRKLDDELAEDSKLWEWMTAQQEAGRITLDIAHISRTKHRNKRDARVATVSVRYACVELKTKSKKSLLLNAVYVQEINAPDAVTPVEWMLLTQAQVSGYEDALKIIEWYKMRWHIENYHRVLKSGCSVEKCQLEDVDRLGRYIGLMSILAWRLYWMSRASRVKPESLCSEFLDEHEWKSLYCKVNNKTTPPTCPPTTYQAIRWIAQLGGFLARKGDGEPGFITIWRGWRRLMDFSEAYLLFVNINNCG